MSWEWSHTGEAYEIAWENLARFSMFRLIRILAEWQAAEPSSTGAFGFNSEKYATELRRLKKECAESRIAKDSLVDAIWEKASTSRVCTSGGHWAWMCPFGCWNHFVSFSTPKRADAKREGTKTK